MGTLYLVATPIGNLEDITARAVRILKEVDLIAAEDTRQAAKLLQHYGIQKRPLSYWEHNKLQRLEQILATLAQGSVALISDAGTPALNDPGYELVRAALQAGHTVTPIPGPSAPLAALVASGLPTDAFLYLGYPPRRRSERLSWLQAIAHLPYTLILLEAPHRLLDCLADLRAVLGERPACLARELTKVHEEIFRGTLSAALEHFTQTPPRGEFTLVVGGAPAQSAVWSEARLRQELATAPAEGKALKERAAELAARSGWPRRQVYRLLLEQRRQPDTNQPPQD